MISRTFSFLSVSIDIKAIFKICTMLPFFEKIVVDLRIAAALLEPSAAETFSYPTNYWSRKGTSSRNLCSSTAINSVWSVLTTSKCLSLMRNVTINDL